MKYDRLGTSLSDTGWGESCVEAGFDKFWDRELFGIEVPEWRRSVVHLVEAAYHAGDGSPVVVADVGCGAATYARHLLARDVPFVYHGFDHNEAVLKAACARWSFLPNDAVHLHLIDVRSTPWPVKDDSYDVLIWDTTLRFCEDVQAAMAQGARACRGWIILARTPIEEKTWREQVRYYGMDAPSANWHFDRDFLEDLARRNGLHLITGLGCEDTHVLSRAPLPTGLSIKSTGRLSRVFHEAYVRERVRRLFGERPGQWAVYGAGMHSRWLLAVLPEELRRRIGCFVDDAAGDDAGLEGVAVLRPEQIDEARIAGVLISSDVLENTLHARAVEWFPQPSDVHRLYEGLPDGPYDKAGVAIAPNEQHEIREVAR